MTDSNFKCQNSDSLYFKSIQHADENNIKNVLLFIQNKEKILELKSFINEKGYDVEIIGVTFPSNEKMYMKKQGKMITYIPHAADGDEIKNALLSRGVKLISGTLPFEGIVVPGASVNPYQVIKQTLGLFSSGLQNVVQSILMATDQGAIKPLEKVIAMNNTISIEASAANTRLLFHPSDGLKINQILGIVEEKTEEANSPE